MKKIAIVLTLILSITALLTFSACEMEKIKSFFYDETVSTEIIESGSGQSGQTESAPISGFDLYYNEEKLPQTTTLYLSRGRAYRFVFNWEEGAEKNYTIKVVPNSKFTFQLDGSAYMLEDNNDITAIFSFTKTSDFFTLNLDRNFNNREAIKNLYPNRTVVVANNLVNSAVAYWRIVVLDKNGNVKNNINFGTGEPIDELDFPENLVF